MITPSGISSPGNAPVRTWRTTAWIAAAFLLLVGAGMVAAHIRHKSSDPWRSPVLLDLKAQLVAEPRNEELKEQIRALDLRLRERYFHLLSVKADGVLLLLGGTAVLLWSLGRVRQLTQRPPMPQPDREADVRLARHARLARNAVAVCGGLTLGGFAVMAFTTTRSPLADTELLAELLGAREPETQAVYAISAEELRSNWPRFRGHEGSGVAGTTLSLASPPTVVWQFPTPGPGFNSPLLWADRVFFTGGNEEVREVFGLSAGTGELLWRQRVEVRAPPSADDPPYIPDMTGHAASTAATDGERVYAIFASGELAAFTLEGRPVWTRHLGYFENSYGHAASLAVWQDRLIVQLDQAYEEDRKSRLLCFDGRTGNIAWQKPRPVGASWSSPIVIESEGQPQIITLGVPWVISYQPDDGTELWRAQVMDGEVSPSPVFADGRLFFVDPGTYQLVAMQADGRGDVTGSHVLWRADGDMPDISSPVSDGELVFTCATMGMLSAFDAASGELVWETEVKARGDFQSSPSLAGGVLLLLSSGGELIAFDAAREPRELWRLPLEDKFHASPAFAHGRMVLRGARQVWCLQGAEKEVAAE